MAFDERHRNSIYSMILFVVLCLIVSAINWDSDFAGAGLIIITVAVGIAVGLFFIVLKLFQVTVSKTNFIYNYFGVLNIILGLVTCFIPAIILLSLAQLLIGLFILHDIFKREKTSSE